jgi:hypothetical protein
MSCGACGKVRAHLPAAIRARLEQVEARMRAKKRPIAISYTTTTPAGRAASPRQLPALPQGGDGAEGAGQ